MISMDSSPDIIKDASDVLKPIEDRGITVMQGWYDKDLNKCHVTLWDLGETDDNFSDDDAEGVTLSLQVTIFSKEDEVELAREIKSLMKENGFSFEGRNGDDSKPEDGIYMKAQRFTKYYESEEKIMGETVTQVNETTQQIVRSRTCGLKDFYIALVQSNTATAYTAGTPVKLARAIKAKIDEKWTSEKIYSDDNTEEVITSYEGTDVELEINALAPQDRVILFGQLYEKGFLRKSSDDRAPEVAVGWRERKLNGKYEFKWLYVGKFAEGISEEASTKEGKLSPTTKSIKGSFYERSIDNLYEVSVDESNLVAEDTDAATAIKDWFSKVQEAPDAAA